MSEAPASMRLDKWLWAARFYTTRALHRDNLRQTIAEHLYAAHHLLVGQIERALNYDHWMGALGSAPSATDVTATETPPAGSGEAVVLHAGMPTIYRITNTGRVPILLGGVYGMTFVQGPVLRPGEYLDHYKPPHGTRDVAATVYEAPPGTAGELKFDPGPWG